MSLKMKISIFVIIASLSIIIGLNTYRFFNDKFANRQESEQEAGFFPFQPAVQKEELQGTEAPQPDEEVHTIQSQDIPQDKLTAQGGMIKPVMNGGMMHLQDRLVDEEQLPPAAQEHLKSRQSSAMEDYQSFRQSEIMQAFNKDMERALKGKVSADDLGNPQKLLQVINDPKVHQILLKYSKDPAFAEIIGNMMKQQAVSSAVQQGTQPVKGQK